MSSKQPDSVLELRIHGVNNTPPHELLDLPKDDVVLAFGDELGSFWRPTPEAVEYGRTDQVQGETSRGVVDPAEQPRGRVPAGIHREAYSWGGMVRTTPPESGPGGAILAAVARAAWTLLLPFSIANAAIWSWKLPSPAKGTRIRYGSSIIRLACLTLTVIFVLSFASIAIGLLALQCYRGGDTVCPPLADTVEVFAGWKDERRVALFSLLPIVALLVVFFVSTLATLRYNIAGRIRSTEDGAAERPLLAEPRFWQSRKETHRLATLHLAAGFAAVALLLGFTFDALSPAVALVLEYAAIAVLVVAGIFTARTDSTPYEKIGTYSRAPEIVLGVAAGLYAIPALILGFHGEIRLDPRSIGTAADQVLVAVVVIALLLIVLTSLLRAPRRAERAWHGLGPAVFLTLGLTISLILGSLINVIVGDWLNGASTANRLDEPYPDCAGGDCLPHEITLGTFYAPFLGITLAFALLAVVILNLMAWRTRNVDQRAPKPTSAAAAAAANSARGSLAGLLGPEIARKRALAARLHLAEPFMGVLACAFFLAILITLVLPYAGQVLPALPEAVATGLARWIDASLGVWVVIGALILAGLVFGGRNASRPLALVWDLACFLPRAGHPFGAPCYTERAVPEVTRRIAWWLDLPAPASAPATPAGGQSAQSAESADVTPTRTARPAPPEPRRTVIVSAHSMGAVVAVSALFALRWDERWETSYRHRVGLLTFGIQLRPYFGRFFPEILGPDVIDCTPCGRPRVLASDPWEKADLGRAVAGRSRRRRPAAAGEPAREVAVETVPGTNPPRGVPGAAWISLWRLTDYLGFPAQSISAAENTRDRYAEEIDVSGYVGVVDTHGWYYRTPSYRTALDDLRTLTGTLPTAERGDLPTATPAPPASSAP
jgi:hypothetical protein